MNLTKAIVDLRTALTEKSEPVGSELSWDDRDRSAPKTPWGPAQQGGGGMMIETLVGVET